LSAKGGLMMGTKKVGAFPSPRKKANVIINPKRKKASDFAKYFLHAKAIVLDNVRAFVPDCSQGQRRTR